MWTIFKVFIDFVTILLLLCFGFFHHKACEILALQPRFKPSPPALEGEVLTTGLPGKSLDAPSFLPPNLALTLSPIFYPSSPDRAQTMCGSCHGSALPADPLLGSNKQACWQNLQPGSIWPLPCACSQTTFSDELQFSSVVESCLTLCDSKWPQGLRGQLSHPYMTTVKTIALTRWASMVAQLVKNQPTIRKTWVQFLGWKDPLEKGKATHSSILAWRIPRSRKEWKTTEWPSLDKMNLC